MCHVITLLSNQAPYDVTPYDVTPHDVTPYAQR